MKGVNEDRRGASTERKQALPDVEKRTPDCTLPLSSDHLKSECFAVWTPLSATGQGDERLCHRA